jgi:hypothetical protein
VQPTRCRDGTDILWPVTTTRIRIGRTPRSDLSQGGFAFGFLARPQTSWDVSPLGASQSWGPLRNQIAPF